MKEKTPSLDTAHRGAGIPGIEETAYTWDIPTGRIDWEPNAALVLGTSTIADIATVAAFEAHLLQGPRERWHGSILGATATGDPAGKPYQTQYQFRPDRGKKAGLVICLDDTGRWWPDQKGRPSRARGVIRVIDARVRDTRIPANHGGASSEPLAHASLSDALAQAIADTERTGKSSALLLAGVSNLSMINTSFGIGVGNEVCAAVAQRLSATLSGGETFAAPYASDKLGIVLKNTDANSVRATAERLIDTIRSTRITTSACELTPALAVGAATISAEYGATADEAMSHALEAFERARLEQTDRFVAFELEKAEDERRRNIEVTSGVLSALDEGRMHFVLQPIICAETGRPAMYECLLRMTRPDGSVASAGEFIHTAEELGLARKIDMRSLELAIALLMKHAELRLSVNVSGFTANDSDWALVLHRLTTGHRDVAQRLMVEITETAMVRNLQRTVEFVDMLRKAGCIVAIDDFGAGYTSFAHLRTLRVDVLKIDGAFVKDLPGDHQGRLLVKSIIEMAKGFGLKTIAEWVGDTTTAEFLREAGVTYLQGFLYGAPIAIEDLPPLA